jgi:hypothetical protein
MKKYLTGFLFLFAVFAICTGQEEPDSLISKCMLNTGPSSKYLKDFRIQLGEGSAQSEFRYKTNLSLWKNTKYRFSMCTADGSTGQLILNMTDDTNKQVLSSADPKTGSVYPFVDFICNKSGIYHIYYDFTDGHSGSGVSIVSLIQ